MYFSGLRVIYAESFSNPSKFLKNFDSWLVFVVGYVAKTLYILKSPSFLFDMTKGGEKAWKAYFEKLLVWGGDLIKGESCFICLIMIMSSK